MTDLWQPKDQHQVEDALRQALEQGLKLELVGRGTKRGLGRPISSNAKLDLSSLSGVRLYEPEELVMTAGPGTPLAEIEATLDKHHQALAFEPPNWNLLWGQPLSSPSIGGAFLCNLSGPRRFKTGAARDHLLGFHAVSGRAESFKSGGRVVKNVTGYDLSKLICGSYGTLAVVTELTFKVLPKPEKARTLLLFGLNAADATKAMSEAVGSSHDVSGAAYLPSDVAISSTVDYVNRAGSSITAIRLEGFGPSVNARLQALREQFRSYSQEELHSHNSANLWQELRDLSYFNVDFSRAFWRISMAPMMGYKVIEYLRFLNGRYVLDWAGGLIWFECASPEPEATTIRDALVACGGGNATLIRAEDAARSALEIFQPESAPVALLSRRIKESFDPQAILNPGRMRIDF